MVSRDGYVSNRADNFRLRGELLSVAPGQHVNDIVVRLLPDGAIAGHVINEAGKPLRDVSVLAMKSSYPHGRRELQDAAHAVTNDAGEYRIESLAPGKYYIRAKPPAALRASREARRRMCPFIIQRQATRPAPLRSRFAPAKSWWELTWPSYLRTPSTFAAQ